jgi:hypothetical protein
MTSSGVPTISNHRLLGMGQVVLSILCAICFRLSVEAAEQTPSAADRDQTSIIVYLHPVATRVKILVDDLTIHETSHVFGVWCYQFNLTSLLDTKPQTVEIKTQLGNKESAYCDIQVRKIAGNPAKTTILAEKTIRAADLETWHNYLTALTINIALPENSVRPLWVEYYNDVDLKPVIRDTSIELVKEIFAAIQKCDFDSLMTLINPALTNQAMMEGTPPDLLKQAMRRKLMRYCIPNIPIDETMRVFYNRNYTDHMAPLNFNKMYYSFIKDPSREDKKGNLYSPEEVIQFSTKDNHLFVARVFLSYIDDRRNKRYVSRFLFEQTE